MMFEKDVQSDVEFYKQQEAEKAGGGATGDATGPIETGVTYTFTNTFRANAGFMIDIDVNNKGKITGHCLTVGDFWIEELTKGTSLEGCVDKLMPPEPTEDPNKDWYENHWGAKQIWGRMSYHHNLELKWLQAFPDQDWNWTIISVAPSLETSWFQAFPDADWNVQKLSKHPNLSIEWLHIFPEKNMIHL